VGGGGLYLEGRFNGGFFALPVGGDLYLEGRIHGGAYFQNFTVYIVDNSNLPGKSKKVRVSESSKQITQNKEMGWGMNATNMNTLKLQIPDL